MFGIVLHSVWTNNVVQFGQIMLHEVELGHKGVDMNKVNGPVDPSTVTRRFMKFRLGYKNLDDKVKSG